TTADLKDRGLTRDRVAAGVVRLIDLGLFRIGGERYAELDHHYGATTLQKQHVRVTRDGILFDYIAKWGKQRTIVIRDSLVQPTVRALARVDNDLDPLWCYEQDGRWHILHSRDVGNYIAARAGGHFTAKEFRTWNATVLMALALANAGPSPTLPGRKRTIAASVREVATWLGDTPAVARGSYIDPRLIARYESDGHLPAVPQAPVALPATAEAETAVAALLAAGGGRLDLGLANGPGPGGSSPEIGLRSRRPHQHHDSGPPGHLERHETPDPVRSDALNVRFQCVGRSARWGGRESGGWGDSGSGGWGGGQGGVGARLRRMGVLLLLRHGQASLGTADYDRLSDVGRRQAQVTGARLARTVLAVDRVVSGALTRQRDTAEPVLAALGWPASRLQIDERLDEYDHVGVMALYTSEVTFETATADGERGRALQSTLEEAIGRWIAGDSGDGETHEAFIGRVMDSITELAATPGATIAVTSGGVIAAYCALALGLPVERWPGLARLIVNASITKIITGHTGTNMVTFNDHAHLETDRALITYR